MSQAIVSSPLGSLAVNVINYSLGYSTLIDSDQLQRGLQHYPIKALQDDFIFTLQFNNISSLNAFQNFILQHYKLIGLPQANNAVIRFYWPQMSFDYAGYIREFSMGLKKFEYAPQRNYKMQLVRDSIYTTTGGYNTTASWQDIYGTDVINTAPPTTSNGGTTNSPVPDPTITPPAYIPPGSVRAR